MPLFQAQESYRTAMTTQLSEFQAEISSEMMDFMFEFQRGVHQQGASGAAADPGTAGPIPRTSRGGLVLTESKRRGKGVLELW